ncbi:MAG: GNAT family N-acetyltransferase [Balneolaceae bacterium]|nr:MAG: GNAT family N-acetyltransferase [Balneolaceae bacterium]
MSLRLNLILVTWNPRNLTPLKVSVKSSLMNVEIRQITQNEQESTFRRVEEMFVEMYRFMADRGLTLTLQKGGEKIWLKSMMPLLGKTNAVVVAFADDAPVGFAAGNIRIAPAFLGNKKVGHLSHLFVDENFRTYNLGRKLSNQLEEWFSQKGVELIELDVLTRSEDVIRFWERGGYLREYVKMNKRP